MDKDLFQACHEELIEQYIEANPCATEAEAYDRTSDKATALAIERLFDVADTLRLQAKEGL